MKTKLILLTIIALVISCGDPYMSKNGDGSFTVVTTEICPDVRGYNGQVPASVTFKGDSIMDVVILENNETPGFLSKVENQMLPKFKGIAISDINNVDCVTGATFTSHALKRNVETAVKYYQEKR
mgnify:FL=1